MTQESIAVTVAKTSLGFALIAQTARGLAAVLLGDDRAELQGELARRIPNAHFTDAKPNDVVGTVRFLWSEQSDYMTGQILVIDGGMVLQ